MMYNSIYSVIFNDAAIADVIIAKRVYPHIIHITVSVH